MVRPAKEQAGKQSVQTLGWRSQPGPQRIRSSPAFPGTGRPVASRRSSNVVVLVGGIGNRDRLLQRGSAPGSKALPPVTGRPRWIPGGSERDGAPAPAGPVGFGHTRGSAGSAPQSGSPSCPLVVSRSAPPRLASPTDVGPFNCIESALELQRIVVLHLASFHMAQNGRQVVLLVQRPMRIVAAGGLHGASWLPPP